MAKQELTPSRWGQPRGWLHRPSEEVFGRLHREMNRLFEDFFKAPGLAPFERWTRGEGILAPEIDVAETDKGIEISAELPGVDEKDVDVTLAEGVLTIKGEKKAEKEEKDKNYYRVERSFGAFQRSLSLPAGIDDSKVTASFDKGVLMVKLPKKPEAKAAVKKVTVKSK